MSYDPYPPNETFAIINTQPSNIQGEHWIMIAHSRHQLHFADSLGGEKKSFFKQQYKLTWNWCPIFAIHLWRFSDGRINRCQPNNSWRWGRQREFSFNNINTRVWASSRACQITERSSIWDSTGKCAWIRIQDSVSLNFVIDTLFVFVYTSNWSFSHKYQIFTKLVRHVWDENSSSVRLPNLTGNS